MARRDAERELESARSAAAKAGAELAAVNQFLRSTADTSGGRALSEALDVEPGYELALAAVLGPRLSAGVVDDLRSGQALLDAAGDAGGMAIVSSRARGRSESAGPPAKGAERLLERVRADAATEPLVRRLLADVWVVDSLEGIPAGFSGVAVTRHGRLLDVATGELAQAPAGGEERLLEERRRRDELLRASESAVDARETGARGTRAARQPPSVRPTASATRRRPRSGGRPASWSRRSRPPVAPSGSSSAAARRRTRDPTRCAAPSSRRSCAPSSRLVEQRERDAPSQGRSIASDWPPA